MTDKWGLVKLLNAARVTRACQWLLKKKKNKKKPTTKILTNYSASSMLMHTDARVWFGFLVLFALFLV